MRIIKFRAWDKENKRWLENRGKSGWYISPEEGIQVSSGWDSSKSPTYGKYDEDGYEQPFYRESTNFEISQFTGFQFLGTDIYEGDILACEGGYEGNECEQPSVVYFDEEDLQFKTKCTCGCGSYPLCEYDIYKIIGNIYENPELLTNPELEACTN